VSDHCKYVHHRASHIGKPTRWNAQNHPQMQHVICGTIPLRATGASHGYWEYGPSSNVYFDQPTAIPHAFNATTLRYTDNNEDSGWYMDTGATSHLSSDLNPVTNSTYQPHHVCPPVQHTSPVFDPIYSPTTCQSVHHNITQPIHPPPQNPNTTSRHLMVTRSQDGTTKPTNCFTLHVSSLSPLTKSHIQASQNPHWQNAMEDEFNAPPEHGQFASYAVQVGFHHSKTDSSLFIFKRGFDTTYLLLYVDDIILTASSSTFLQRIIFSLRGEFAMTDLGPLNYFFGIAATRTSDGIFLSQTKYATEILERAHMVNCNPCRTL
nr:ribonuclease H-like domain-containing protein [Tanacetum cinerariifolium]